MNNSIQQFNEIGARKIEEVIKNFLKDKKDIGDLILGIQENLYELGRNIVQETLEDMDEYIRDLGVRKNNWEVVRKDPNCLLTSFGEVHYERTYYKPKKGGCRKYLVDDISGIRPHDRTTSDVDIRVIEEAIETSYAKSGREATYVDEISRQTVMNKLREIEIVEPEIKVNEKKKLKKLFIEVDEDHVTVLNKNKKECGMPMLVYVHEGKECVSKKRNRIINPRYFGGYIQKAEEIWLNVCRYIENVYDTEYIERIYISGDGATWVKTGLNWIPKSKFVLDKYHLSKYIVKATSHVDEKYKTQLEDAIAWPDKEAARRVFAEILEESETEAKEDAVLDCRRYILNQWDGIEIRGEFGQEIVGCSAEGHVSHVYSGRLSSRPKVWSRVGLEQMTKLLIYKENGGKIYDLVMYQKEKERKEQKHQIQDEQITKLRNSLGSKNYMWDITPTAIDVGRKTRLYMGLKNLIGISG